MYGVSRLASSKSDDIITRLRRELRMGILFEKLLIQRHCRHTVIEIILADLREKEQSPVAKKSIGALFDEGTICSGSVARPLHCSQNAGAFEIGQIDNIM